MGNRKQERAVSYKQEACRSTDNLINDPYGKCFHVLSLDAHRHSVKPCHWRKDLNVT